MLHILLIVHLFIALALIAITLLQKSEGGVLGIGGGAKMGGLMSGSSAGDFLSRFTTYLTLAFFVLSLTLSLMVYVQNKSQAALIPVLKQELPQTPAAPQVPTQ